MRVAVRVLFLLQEGAAGAEQLQHCLIRGRHASGLEHRHANEFLRHPVVGHVAPLVVQRAVDLQPVFLSGLVIFQTVARRGVHAAGAAFGGHVVREHDRARPVDERMPRLDLLEFAAPHRLLDFKRGEIAVRGKTLRHRRSHEIAMFARMHDGVIEIGMDGDREIGRERPGRGRPDDDVQGAARAERRGVRHRKLHPDRRADVVLVFDLGLGQRRLAGDRPVDRLLAAINQPVFDKGGERAQHFRFVRRRHRAVFLVPITKRTEALELRPHLFNVIGRKTRAGFAQLRGRQRPAFGAQLARHPGFDRQAVTVPAGNERGSKTARQFIAHHDVF